MEQEAKHRKYVDELADVLVRVSHDKVLFKDLLVDLLTPSELAEIAKRWQIVRMLDEGVSHHEIAEKLRVGIATVTRGSREMQEESGGFQRTFHLLNKK